MANNYNDDLEGEDLRLMVVGDPAYPLRDWCTIGRMCVPLDQPEQESFNVYLSSLRVGVEMAFGWSQGGECSLKEVTFTFSFAPTMLATCCALHNFCEKRNDGVNLNWLNNICEADQLYPQPTQPVHASVGTSGKSAREALTKYLAHHFPLRQGHHWKQTPPKRGHYCIFAIFYF